MDSEVFDLYEDLDNFNAEQALKQRNQDYEILEKKYNNALKKITELEEENKTLKELNETITKNFTDLLATAKTEIKRKNNQLVALRQEKDDICFRRYNRPQQSVSYEVESKKYSTTHRNEYTSTKSKESEYDRGHEKHSHESYSNRLEKRNERKESSRKTSEHRSSSRHDDSRGNRRSSRNDNRETSHENEIEKNNSKRKYCDALDERSPKRAKRAVNSNQKENQTNSIKIKMTEERQSKNDKKESSKLNEKVSTDQRKHISFSEYKCRTTRSTKINDSQKEQSHNTEHHRKDSKKTSSDELKTQESEIKVSKSQEEEKKLNDNVTETKNTPESVQNLIQEALTDALFSGEYSRYSESDKESSSTPNKCSKTEEITENKNVPDNLDLYADLSSPVLLVTESENIVQGKTFNDERSEPLNLSSNKTSDSLENISDKGIEEYEMKEVETEKDEPTKVTPDVGVERQEIINQIQIPTPLTPGDVPEKIISDSGRKKQSHTPRKGAGRYPKMIGHKIEGFEPGGPGQKVLEASQLKNALFKEVLHLLPKPNDNWKSNDGDKDKQFLSEGSEKSNSNDISNQKQDDQVMDMNSIESQKVVRKRKRGRPKKQSIQMDVKCQNDDYSCAQKTVENPSSHVNEIDPQETIDAINSILVHNEEENYAKDNFNGNQTLSKDNNHFEDLNVIHGPLDIVSCDMEERLLIENCSEKDESNIEAIGVEARNKRGHGNDQNLEQVVSKSDMITSGDNVQLEAQDESGRNTQISEESRKERNRISLTSEVASSSIQEETHFKDPDFVNEVPDTVSYDKEEEILIENCNIQPIREEDEDKGDNPNKDIQVSEENRKKENMLSPEPIATIIKNSKTDDEIFDKVFKTPVKSSSPNLSDFNNSICSSKDNSFWDVEKRIEEIFHSSLETRSKDSESDLNNESTQNDSSFLNNEKENISITNGIQTSTDNERTFFSNKYSDYVMEKVNENVVHIYVTRKKRKVKKKNKTIS